MTAGRAAPIPGWLRAAPTLGVLTGGAVPAPVVNLLTRARRWCAIVVLTADVTEPVDAVVACQPALLDRACGPTAAWVDTVAELDAAGVAEAEVILSGLDEVIGRAGSRGLLVPADPPSGVHDEVAATVDWTTLVTAVPVAPFVRRRLRVARHLPDPLIVEHDGDGWAEVGTGTRIPAELAATAVACASAAVVAGPALLWAAAWGTPCVTDAATESDVGARRFRDVLVGDTPAERRSVARAVATDDELAASLSWGARTLVDTRHRPDLVAASLVRRLQLSAACPSAGPAPVAARLSEMGTPERSTITQRVNAAMSLLTAPGTTD